MQNLRIVTWNIKNSYFKMSKNEEKAKAVVGLLDTYQPDFLALQEVNPMLAREIQKRLSELNDYQIATTYKDTKNPVSNLRIEYNMIISKLTPETASVTHSLPFLPKGFHLLKDAVSIRKRNVTSQTFDGNIVVDNTHLAPTEKETELNKRQLDQVASVVESQKTLGSDVILAGNLNSKPTEQNMIDFAEKMSDIGMQIIENPHNTYKGHTDHQPVDYLAVPSDWEVEKVETIDCDSQYSSHNPVIVDVTRKR